MPIAVESKFVKKLIEAGLIPKYCTVAQINIKYDEAITLNYETYASNLIDEIDLTPEILKELKCINETEIKLLQRIRNLEQENSDLRKSLQVEEEPE